VDLTNGVFTFYPIFWGQQVLKWATASRRPAPSGGDTRGTPSKMCATPPPPLIFTIRPENLPSQDKAGIYCDTCYKQVHSKLRGPASPQKLTDTTQRPACLDNWHIDGTNHNQARRVHGVPQKCYWCPFHVASPPANWHPARATMYCAGCARPKHTHPSAKSHSSQRRRHDRKSTRNRIQTQCRINRLKHNQRTTKIPTWWAR